MSRDSPCLLPSFPPPATKFIGGHSDVTAGILAVKDAELAQRIYFVQACSGGVRVFERGRYKCMPTVHARVNGVLFSADHPRLIASCLLSLQSPFRPAAAECGGHCPWPL
jgi:hypothetical protein